MTYADFLKLIEVLGVLAFAAPLVAVFWGGDLRSAGLDQVAYWLQGSERIAALLPYLALFPAFLKLRKINPNIERPYKVPGGKVFATILAVICELFIIQAVVLFVYVPGQPMDWAFAGPVLIGVVLTLIVGEILIAVSKKNKKTKYIFIPLEEAGGHTPRNL